MPDLHAVVYIYLWLLFDTEEAHQSVKESGNHKCSEVFWWAKSKRELIFLKNRDEFWWGGDRCDRCDGCDYGGLYGCILVELHACVWGVKSKIGGYIYIELLLLVLLTQTRCKGIQGEDWQRVNSRGHFALVCIHSCTIIDTYYFPAYNASEIKNCVL